jgi:CheY-like chemotaxis protein
MKVILAIDDDKSTLLLIASQLEGMRYRLFTENNPKKGLETARTLNPDLILLDVNMPLLNGLELLKLLKKDVITIDIPVIMLTAVTDRAVVVDAMRHGIIDYIAKPWNPGNLFLKMTTALRYRDMQRMAKRMDNSSFINVSREGKRVLLSFSDSPGTREFLLEAKSVFNSFFMNQIKSSICVIDLRTVPDFTPADTKALEAITRLFSDKGVNVIAGRHYGTIVSSTDLDEKTNLFISYGDMEIFLESGKRE